MFWYICFLNGSWSFWRKPFVVVGFYLLIKANVYIVHFYRLNVFLLISINKYVPFQRLLLTLRPIEAFFIQLVTNLLKMAIQGKGISFFTHRMLSIWIAAFRFIELWLRLAFAFFWIYIFILLFCYFFENDWISWFRDWIYFLISS